MYSSSRKLCWAFGAIVFIAGAMLTPICFGQPEPTPAVAVSPPAAKHLKTLETTATFRAVTSSAPLSPNEYSELVAASQRYASSIAGSDDTQFTRLATNALSQAIATKRGVLRAGGVSDGVLTAAAPLREAELAEQVWGLPGFQKNYRKLMETAGKGDSGLFPITGPPSLSRIVGTGTQLVPDTSFMDCVCVGRRVGSSDQFCCTGTLVGKNVVVTAGHCFFCTGGGADNAVVYFGTDTATVGKRVRGKAIRHPRYGQDGLHNDIAVIVLDEPVAGVQPRRIATTDEINASTFVRAIGFGNSDFASTTGFGIKRMVDVPIASISCSGDDDPAELGCDNQLELVAGFVGLGPDSCNGDSGGPIYVLVGSDARDDSAWAIAGATSRATDLATRPCGDGGIYARLDAYVDFIKGVPGGQF